MDRMESQGLDYLERVRQGYLAEARLHPERMVVIDADRPIDTVQADIRQAAGRLINP
jgi:dTMP kinase